jgi:hypothetical protein
MLAHHVSPKKLKALMEIGESFSTLKSHYSRYRHNIWFPTYLKLIYVWCGIRPQTLNFILITCEYIMSASRNLYILKDSYCDHNLLLINDWSVQNLQRCNMCLHIVLVEQDTITYYYLRIKTVHWRGIRRYWGTSLLCKIHILESQITIEVSKQYLSST